MLLREVVLTPELFLLDKNYYYNIAVLAVFAPVWEVAWNWLGKIFV